jgi:hypothetical protein
MLQFLALCPPPPAALPTFELLAIADLQEEKITGDSQYKMNNPNDQGVMFNLY